MTRAQRGWALYAAVFPLVAVAATQAARRDVDWATAWPVWRPAVLDSLLVLAGGLLATAVVAGVLAWRREARRHA